MGEILLYVSAFSLLPAFIFAIAFKRDVSFSFGKVFVGLIWLGAIADISMTTLASYGVNNMPLFHVYTLLEFLLIFLIYRIYYNKKNLGFVGLLGGGTILYIIINSIFIETIFTFNSYAKMVESAALIFLSMIWFMNVFREMKIEKLSEHPMFYISTGVLLYFSGNFFIFTYYNVVADQDWRLMNEIWNIHSVLNIVFNLLLATALWKMRPKYQLE